MNLKRSIFYLIIFISANHTTYSQTKKVRINNSNSLEEFYVLKSNHDIKQGEYKKYIKFSNPYKTGKVLVEEGNFLNNEKNGVWNFYDTSSDLNSTGFFFRNKKDSVWQYFENGTLVMKGKFEDGFRTGNWNYYDSNTGHLNRGKYLADKKIGQWRYQYRNKLYQIYDHSMDSVIYTLKEDSKHYILQDNDTIWDRLDRVPQYIGYKFNLNREVGMITDYPNQARRMGIEGAVSVAFVINEDGSLSNFTIIKNIMPGLECANAVIKALQESNKKWISGIYNGKLIKTIVIQNVNFELAYIEENTGFGITRITYN